jgi:hypothetical protein
MFFFINTIKTHIVVGGDANHMRNTCFFLLILLKKTCEKHVLLKQHVLLTCQGTHVTLICGCIKFITN